METESIFLEVFINANDFEASGFGGRSAVEDEVEDALEKAKLGKITGGGGGIYGVNIDIEVKEKDFEVALDLIRKTLRKIKVPKSTVIKKRAIDTVIYPVYY